MKARALVESCSGLSQARANEYLLRRKARALNKLPRALGQIKAVLWIRIRINLAVLDPDPYWECGSGYKSMKIDQQIN